MSGQEEKETLPAKDKAERINALPYLLRKNSCAAEALLQYFKLIAHSSDCFQNKSAVYCFQTAAEKMNVVVQVAFLHVAVQSPYAGEKKRTGKGLAGIAQ